jgi:hypothetical protein
MRAALHRAARGAGSSSPSSSRIMKRTHASRFAVMAVVACSSAEPLRP